MTVQTMNVLVSNERFAGKSDILSGVDATYSFRSPAEDSCLFGIFDHVCTFYDSCKLKLEKEKTNTKSYPVEMKPSLTSQKVLDNLMELRVYSASFEEFLHFCKKNSQEIKKFSRESPLICLTPLPLVLSPVASKGPYQSFVSLTYSVEGEQYLDFAPYAGMWQKNALFLVTKVS